MKWNTLPPSEVSGLLPRSINTRCLVQAVLRFRSKRFDQPPLTFHKVRVSNEPGGYRYRCAGILK